MVPPKLTVLMALYNGGEYLGRSVKSVLGQTYRDFEFLIINDCSTDNSLETIASFHDDRVKIHHNSSNVGQTRSLNVGLKLALGEYVARIDADDIAFPCWLERQMAFIAQNPGYSVISTQALVIDEKNKIKKVYKPPVLPEDIILRALVASPINHVGAFFKKKDIVDNGGYDEAYKTAADYDLWGKLLRNALKITTTSEMLVAIREHAQSLSRSERGKRELSEIIDIAQRNIDAFTNAQLSHEEVRLFCRANYEAGDLADTEFLQALSITKKVYGSLRPSLGIKKHKAMQWLGKRYETIYWKRIFAAIAKQDYAQVRKLSWNGIRSLGFRGMFFVFVVGSLWGRIFLSHIPCLYERVLRKRACSQVNGKLRMTLLG